MVISKIRYTLSVLSIFLCMYTFYSINWAQSSHLISPLFNRNYDVQHIRLVLNFDEDSKSLNSTATISLVPLELGFKQCKLHAKDLAIKAVTVNNSSDLNFHTDSEIITVNFFESYTPQDTLHITIKYYTTPQKGIYFNSPTETDQLIPNQIYSHSEPIDARCWFPCYDNPDDKFTSEIIATVNSNYFLLSNGILVSTEENQTSKTTTFHWQQHKPHTSYLMSIVAGEYEVINDSFNNIPLQYYVYEEQVDQVQCVFSDTKKMMSIFEHTFGYPYPWDKYVQIIVHDYISRGMEHTSATTLVDDIMHDQRAFIDFNSDRLIAHELAHQWFGNLVTCKDWSHIWLNEGFATYSEILYIEQTLGSEAAQYDVFSQQRYYLQLEDSDFHQPIVYKNYLHPEEMFNHISYQKASMVLHMLRNLIGDDAFFRALRVYLHEYAYASVESSNFTDIVQATSGNNLDWFFDQWLYYGGHPELEVSYDWFPDSNLVLLYVNQVQQDTFNLVPKVFRFPADIEIHTKHQKYLEKHEIDSREDTLRFYVDSKPVMVRFDKNNIILKTIQFIKTQDECAYQLLHDNTIWGQLDAIHQLQKNTTDTLATIHALSKVIKFNSFWAVRREAAYALEMFQTDDIKSIFIEGCNDPHSKVRSACVQILGDYKDPKLFPLLKSIAQSDSSYSVVSRAIYGMINIPDSLTFKLLKSFYNMESYNNIIQSAAFEGFRVLKDEKSIPFAIQIAENTDLAFSRRYSALRLIEEIGIGNNLVKKSLLSLLNDRDDGIKRKVVQILGDFRSEDVLYALESIEKKELSDSVRRRILHAIKKIEKAIIEENH